MPGHHGARHLGPALPGLAAAGAGWRAGSTVLPGSHRSGVARRPAAAAVPARGRCARAWSRR